MRLVVAQWPAVIGTARLTLRPFSESDLPMLVEMLTNDAVRRFLGGALSRADALASLAGRDVGSAWGCFAVTVTDTGEVVGEVSFGSVRSDLDVDWPLRPSDLEVVWQLLPTFWGQGVATEALTAALKWAFAATDASRLIAWTQTANVASCRLADRVGMRRVAVFDKKGAEQALYVLERDARAPGDMVPTRHGCRRLRRGDDPWTT